VLLLWITLSSESYEHKTMRYLCESNPRCVGVLRSMQMSLVQGHERIATRPPSREHYFSLATADDSTACMIQYLFRLRYNAGPFAASVFKGLNLSIPSLLARVLIWRDECLPSAAYYTVMTGPVATGSRSVSMISMFATRHQLCLCRCLDWDLVLGSERATCSHQVTKVSRMDAM
jgi:hypothetical protein